MSLSELKDTSRPSRRKKRIGRGPSSGMGKTSGRGHKGAGSRSGYKRRLTYEGGQMRLFQKLPQRGFTRGRHLKRLDSINISTIDRYFNDGDVVDHETLRKAGLIGPRSHGVKLLGNGELTKKLTSIHVDAMSAVAREKVEKAGIAVL